MFLLHIFSGVFLQAWVFFPWIIIVYRHFVDTFKIWLFFEELIGSLKLKLEIPSRMILRKDNTCFSLPAVSKYNPPFHFMIHYKHSVQFQHCQIPFLICTQCMYSVSHNVLCSDCLCLKVDGLVNIFKTSVSETVHFSCIILYILKLYVQPSGVFNKLGMHRFSTFLQRFRYQK